MMSVVAAAQSEPTMLALHAVRLLGFADTSRVASRFNLVGSDVQETLLYFEAYGWVLRSTFADSSGWSLTDAGRAENERRLAAELDAIRARPVIAGVHQSFLPLNARFMEAVTRWQTRPMPGDAMAANDHTDFRWDDNVLKTLTSLGRRLHPLTSDLSAALTRFDGYAARYDAALSRAIGGEHQWVDGISVDSCHLVWMQLHEDLISSLGLARGDHH